MRILAGSIVVAGLIVSNAFSQPVVNVADPMGNPDAVVVVYSTAMDASSAQNTGNYQLTNAAGTTVPITTAVLQSDQVTVILSLGTSLQLTTNYTLVIRNVKDAWGNYISPNPTLVSFWFGGNPFGVSYDFDDGLVPPGTELAAYPVVGGTINPYQGVGYVAGNPTPCLIVVSNATGETFGQWFVTNDVTGGAGVSSLKASFKLWMGTGTGGNCGTPNPGGNGMIFHVGPRPPKQYSGGASSWGNGLDVTFRWYTSPPNNAGINIAWIPPRTTFNPGAAENLIATTNFLDFLDTNDVTYANFENNSQIWIDLSYNEELATNVLSLVVSNARIGAVVVYTNLVIPNFTPIHGGTPGVTPVIGFTATDGAGAHGAHVVDDVDLTVNGVHVSPGFVGVGPVGISAQPIDITTNENVRVTFSVGVTGAPPYSFQWYSNNVAIPGANAASYTTPLTLYSTMNGAQYYVVVSNWFSWATSEVATLTIIPDTVGIHPVSVGSLNGYSIGVLFSGYVDLATAANPANYLVNGGAVTVTSVDVRTNLANYGDILVNYAPSYMKGVRLNLASPVSGVFTVTVKSNVLSRTGLRVPETVLTGVVQGMSSTDIGEVGVDPYAAGDAIAWGTNKIEVVGGGSNFLPVGIQPADAGHFAYQSAKRTGNFDIAARLVFLTPTAASAKGGICVRPDLGASSPALALEVFPTPGNNTYQTAMRPSWGEDCVSWAAPGAPVNGNLGAFWGTGGNWLRIRRLGATFQGLASADGMTWQLIGFVTNDINNFPADLYVGLMVTAANNDGRLCQANYESWGRVVFPDAVVTITTNLPSTTPGYEGVRTTLRIGASVTGADTSELVYQWQRKDPGGAAFYDILEGGNSATYTTPFLSIANDHGAQYRVIAYVGDITTGHSVTSAVTTLSVSVDNVPPYMTDASADETFMRVIVTFDGLMGWSACDPANYTIRPAAGGSALTINSISPVYNPDYTFWKVVIDLGTALTSGTVYQITVSNVLDMAGNNINNTTVPGGRQRNFTGWMLAYGYLKYDRWYLPSGTGGFVESVLDSAHYQNDPPDWTELITYSGYPNGTSTNPYVNVFWFGARISGFVIPPTTADYLFYVRGNDGTALWVSPDSSPANKVLKAVANVGFASPGTSWLYSLTNTAALGGVWKDTNAMSLQAGQLYYVEAVEKQADGTSFIEFTWGTDGQTVKGGVSVTNVPTGAWPVASGGRGGAPTNVYNLTGNEIAVYVNPDASAITATGPTNTAVEHGKTATLCVSATAAVSAGGMPSTVPISYQWYSNNVLIAGATNPCYTIAPVSYPSPDVTYSVVMSVPGISFMTKTNSAVVTVTPDATPPYVVAASGFGGRFIGLRFDGVLDPVTATTPTYYTLSGATVTNAILWPDRVTVQLQLNTAIPAGSFTVYINGVKDAAGNVANTNATGTMSVTQLGNAADIGVLGETLDPANLGAGVMVTNGVIEILAGGQGFGSNAFVGGVMSNSPADGIYFAYEQRTGDFDIVVKVEDLLPSNARAKAGLMVRQSLAANAVQYMIAVEPAAVAATDGSGIGYNGVTLLRRQTNSHSVTAWGNNPQPPVLGSGKPAITPIWLRLQRVGPNLYAYTGADRTNWLLCGRSTVISPAYGWTGPVYVGLAVASGNMTNRTIARFTGYGDYTLPAMKRALFVVGGAANTAAGAPNAPQQTSDNLAYNDLIRLGFQVTVTHAQTARAEDAQEQSLIVISSTITSGDMGTPNIFTATPVPLFTWEGGTFGKLRLAGSDSTTLSGQTAINITNTAPPVASELCAGYSGPVTVLNSGQNVLYVAKTALPEQAVIVAQPGGGTTPELRACFFAYEKGATMALGTNAAARRVAWGIGEDAGRANYNAAGLKLFTNALMWAAAGATNAPTITANPASQAVAVGTPAMFMVTAVGPGPFTYQWWKIAGGATNAIPGATARAYSIWSPTLADDATAYYVVVTGTLTGLSATSAVATLTVQQPIAITQQPQDATVGVGQQATFSVVVTGSAPQYQWYSNGVAIVDATNATYTTPPVTLADDGTQYYVVVNNLISSVVSATATLHVSAVQPPVFNPPQLIGTNLYLSWSGGGFLLESTNVLGPWITNGATSPAVIPIDRNVRQKFFRVQLQ